MNTTPTIKVANDGPEVGVATARLLLQNALAAEEQNGNAERPGHAHKHALNDLTGASIHLPLAEEDAPPAENLSTATTKLLGKGA